MKLIKLPGVEELKTLQVKAELVKLGDPHRAYSEKLSESSMTVDTDVSHAGRLSIAERFSKIESATRPALAQAHAPQQKQ